MALTYRDIQELLNRNPKMLDQKIFVFDPLENESYPVENAFINNEDSPTSDVLDKGHLVLIQSEIRCSHSVKEPTCVCQPGLNLNSNRRSPYEVPNV